jgi:hypothetical protein
LWASVFVSAVLIPASVRGETLVTPWLGVNTGSSTSASVGVGAGVEHTFGGAIGVELEFGYSPDYFGNGLNSSVVTTMGNVVVGIPLDGARRAGIRPYVTGGLGLVHSRLDVVRSGVSLEQNDAGVNFGGGVSVFFGSHLGVRADLRHIRSLGDATVVTGPFGPIDFGGVHYWRTSFAVVVR